MDVQEILSQLSEAGYRFQVFGVGEDEADVFTTNATEAWDHVEAQDETNVILWKDGYSQGTLYIVGDDGEFEIVDYGARENELTDLLDNLTRED